MHGHQDQDPTPSRAERRPARRDDGSAKGSDTVELKLTVPRRPAARRDQGARPRPARGPDPPGHLLRHAGSRARQGGRRGARAPDPGPRGRRVIKLRPVVPRTCRPRAASSPGFGVEVDAIPGGFVCSGRLKCPPTRRDPRRLLGARSCARSSRRSSGRCSPTARPRASSSTGSRRSARSSSSS